MNYLIQLRPLLLLLLLSVLISQDSLAKEECNNPPIAVITKNLSGTTFFSGTTITFSGTSSNSGNCLPMSTHLWLVDGQWSGNPTVTKTFTLPAGVYEQNYIIYLEVENSNGQTDDTTVEITIKKPRRVYYVKDHLGSIRTTVSREGTILAYDDYYPFGQQMPGRSWKNASIGDNVDNTKFTGHEQDDEAGLNLYHANARGYDPELGRFMQIDPLAQEFTGWSPYNYALNSPMNYRDPDGKAPQKCPPCGAFDIYRGMRNELVSDVTGAFYGVASVFAEPVDWAYTAYDMNQNGANWTHLASLLPFASKGLIDVGSATFRGLKMSGSFSRLDNALESSVGNSILARGDGLLGIGDDGVRKALGMSSNSRAADFVSFTSGGKFNITEVKASLGRSGADISHALSQLKSTSDFILKNVNGASIGTIEIALPKGAKLKGNFKVSGNQLMHVTDKGEEVVRLNGSVVHVNFYD